MIPIMSAQVGKKLAPKWSSIIRRRVFVRVGMALLKEVCYCGGGL